MSLRTEREWVKHEQKGENLTLTLKTPTFTTQVEENQGANGTEMEQTQS